MAQMTSASCDFLGVSLSSVSLQAIHRSVVEMESLCLVCKIVGIRLSGRELHDYILASYTGEVRLVDVFLLGRGYFRLQFESPS